MNIIDIQDNLKNLPEQALMQEMQRPTGSAPQFLVLGELKRRKQMREDYKRQQNVDMKTVAEEVVTAAGAPQEGIMQVARSLNPNTNMAQDTGLAQATPVTPTQAPQPQAPQMMSGGGIMRMARGGRFGTDIEYNYKTFLQENNLNDTPYAQDMFARLQETMDNKYATEGPNNNPRIYDNAIGFERSPEGLGSVSSDASDFMPDRAYSSQDESRFYNPYYSLGRVMNAGLNTMGFGNYYDVGPQLPEGTDAAFIRQTSPAAPQSTLDQLRSSVYSNNPLENALAGTGLDSNVIGTSVIDPIRNRIDEAVSREGMPSQTAADIANETALRNREMASENAGRLTAEELLAPNPEAYDVTDTRFDNVPTPGVRPSDTPRLSELNGRPSSVSELYVPDLNPIAAAAQTAAAPKYTIQDYGLLPVGSVPTPEEKIQTEVASLNAQIAAAGDDEVLIDLLNRRKDGLIRQLQVAELQTDTGEFLSNIPATIDRGFQQYIAPGLGLTTPQEAVARINAIDASSADATASERAREAEIKALVGGATTVPSASVVEQESLLPMDTGEPLTVPSAEESGIGSLLPPKAAPKTTTPVATKDTGGAGFGSMDSRIAQMLSNRQKEAESDKWMALAQTGMALMASKNPTFGGALGEAGLAGIGALQKSKQGARAFETDMLKLQTQLDIARQRARGSSKLAPASLVTAAATALKTAQSAYENASTDAERLAASDDLIAARTRYEQISNAVASQYPGIASALTSGGTGSGRKQV
jgi:hypothetical protein